MYATFKSDGLVVKYMRPKSSFIETFVVYFMFLYRCLVLLIIYLPICVRLVRQVWERNSRSFRIDNAECELNVPQIPI